MANGNSVMQLEQGAGWTRGLNNVLRAEFGRWFGTRRWWMQILIWASVVNLIPAMASLSPNSPDVPELVTLFNIFLGLAAPIGVCIMMQEALVGEKQTGTAAWVLSKPVSRLAFLFSKLVASTVGIAATMLLAQGAIMVLVSTLVLGKGVAPLGMLAGLGIHLVHISFYIGLTLMLGALFSHRAPVIGLPMAFLFAQQYLPALYSGLADVLPWTLAIPMNNSQAPSVAMALMLGVQSATYLPVVTTLAAAGVFLAIAAWVFHRQDL